MSYTYTLDGTTVTPEGEWTINYQRNAGQIFFRRILRGELIFMGDDYDFITGQSVCTDMEFKILCDGAEYWVGSIKYPYGFTDVDDDACIIKGTPEVVDEYTCIMQNYETVYFVPRPAVGGVAPDLRTCVGGLLINIPTCVRLGAPSGSGLSNYLDEIINDVNRLNCGLTLRSSFMWRDDFPNGTNYAGAYAANNYITGAANRLEYIFLYANSNLRSVFGLAGCTDTGDDDWTFKDFETFMRNAFNAYWYIDQNGHFRVEHIHFFDEDFVESDFEDGVDLTALTGKCLPTFASRKNKYTYLTDLLFDQEVWKWQYYDGTEGTITHGADFEGVPIFYGAAAGDKSDCVAGDFKEKEWTTPLFWSDIDWAFQLIAAATLSTIDCRGFCFVDVDDPLGVPTIRCEVGALTAANIINGHCSTANLQDHYFTWDRIFLDGDMNTGGVILFDSEIRKELQVSIEFPWCCEDTFNPLDFIVTEMGSGQLNEASLSRLRNSLTVELKY